MMERTVPFNEHEIEFFKTAIREIRIWRGESPSILLVGEIRQEIEGSDFRPKRVFYKYHEEMPLTKEQQGEGIEYMIKKINSQCPDPTGEIKIKYLGTDAVDVQPSDL